MTDGCHVEANLEVHVHRVPPIALYKLKPGQNLLRTRANYFTKSEIAEKDLRITLF